MYFVQTDGSLARFLCLRQMVACCGVTLLARLAARDSLCATAGGSRALRARRLAPLTSFSGLFLSAALEAVDCWRSLFYPTDFMIFWRRGMMQPERPFADYELSRLAQSLTDQFVQRWDLYARQLDDGRYLCIHSTLSNGHMLAHLRREITLGVYLLNPQSEARFMVFDADEPQQFSSLMHLAKVLEAENVPSYLEQSRRGGHLWLFFSAPIPGTHAREFGQGLLTVHQIEPMELFPKQDQLSGGPGSLIRMPFGMHRRSGQRYGFINPDGEPIASTVRQQIKLLSVPQIVPEAAFEAYRSCVPIRPSKAVLDPLESPGELVSQRIKDKISVLEFVSQYVELKPTNQGALGICPFHDDHNPSLSINDQGNYWNCFAGCGGGSVIDFWMMWAECDFVEAITELAHILL